MRAYLRSFLQAMIFMRCDLYFYNFIIYNFMIL